jgi:hypothetical protein
MEAANDNVEKKEQKALAVYSIRETERGSIWTRCGRAYANRDGSMNIYLEALPVTGKLHVRVSAPPAEASAPSRAA